MKIFEFFSVLSCGVAFSLVVFQIFNTVDPRTAWENHIDELVEEHLDYEKQTDTKTR